MTWILDSAQLDPKEVHQESLHAEFFLRAGGTLTRAEWMSLDEVDAAALVLAADRLWHSRSAMLLIALTQPGGLQAFLAEQDPELVKLEQLRQAVAKAGERLEADYGAT